MEETLLLNILSESWIVAFLFISTLFGLYKLGKYLWSNYIDITKENHRLEREATAVKDLEFLRRVKEVVDTVKDWDDKHEVAHDKIGEIMQDWHNKITSKLEDIHEEVKKITK